MWFVQYLEYLFNLYIILFYFADIFSGDDEVVFVQYDFPPDKIEAANSLAQNQLPASFHVGVAMTANRTAEVWNASGEGQSIWDYMTRERPVIVNNRSNADVEAAVYQEYKKDIQLAKMIGCDIYGVLLSWQAILPNGLLTRVNQESIRYYNDLINEMLASQIQPVVTIYERDLPYTLQQLGGWNNPLMAHFFEDYARIVFNAFGDRVKYWITINGPIDTCAAFNQSSIVDYLCGHNMLLAHARVYDMYNREFSHQKGKIGIELPLKWFEPANKISLEDLAATERAYQWFDGWFLHPLLEKNGDYPGIMISQLMVKSFFQGFSHSRLPTFTRAQVKDLQGSVHFLAINYRAPRIIRANKPSIYNISFWNDVEITEISDSNSAGNLSVQETSRGLEKLLDRLNIEYLLPEIIIIDVENYEHSHISEVISAMKKGINITGIMV